MTTDSATPSSGWPGTIRKSWGWDRDKAHRVLALILLCWSFVFPIVGRLIAGLIWASAQLVAGEDAISNAKENPDRQEIVLLRAQLAAQQAQIDQLRKELQEQRELIERTHQPAGAASSLHTAGSAPVADPPPGNWTLLGYSWHGRRTGYRSIAERQTGHAGR